MKKKAIIKEQNGTKEIYAVGYGMMGLLNALENITRDMGYETYRYSENILEAQDGNGIGTYTVVELDTITREWDNAGYTDQECLESIME